MELVPAARPIKIHDLLRQTSGLTYAFIGKGPVKDAYKQAGLASFSLDLSIADYVDKLAELPLLWQPGSTWDYGRSTDVLGAVMEVVAGAPLDTFLSARVFEPLGMVDTGFWVPEAKHGRIAEPQVDPETGATDSLIDITHAPKMFAGGHGLVSTAADYARFCQMMLDGGVLDGARLLSRKTVEFMTADHLGDGISKDGTLYLPGPGYGFGLGFGVRTSAGESPWPGSVGEFFWGGYAGTYFWIDPAEQLVVVYMMQSVKHRSHYRMQLRNLVLQAIVD
jgi:CubicO group peptidase (beta-lactamase class C family)